MYSYLIRGLLAAGGLILSIVIYKGVKKIKGTKFAVLGMQGAGKTQFYNTLRGNSNAEAVPTSKEGYQSFKIKCRGKTITVAKGVDISGNETSIKYEYERMIKENEVIFFIFNIKEYLQSEEEEGLVNARFDYIFEKAKTHKKDIDGNVVIIGSHADCLSKEEQSRIKNKFDKKVGKKTYSELFNKNVFFVNLTDKSEVDKMIDKIF